MKKIIKNVEMSILLILIIANSFHISINSVFPFYREMVNSLFLIFIAFRLLLIISTRNYKFLSINKTLILILIFPILLSIWSLLDSGISLYDDQDIGNVSTNITSADLTLYIIRNAVLYLPMVIYFALRGLDENNIRSIAMVAILSAPISIFNFLTYASIITSFKEIGLVASLGGEGLSYNSYVPYLTFSVPCAFYILFSCVQLHIKWLIGFAVIVVICYCLISTSRQSFLFILISLLINLYYLLDKKFIWKNLNHLLPLTLIVILLYLYNSNNIILSDKFTERYSSLNSAAETTRGDAVLDGLQRLKPLEFLFGAGLTSIVHSGPHNDYIRWTQRVGLPLMLIGFLPFFKIHFRALKSINRESSNKVLSVFLACISGFVIFHSFFGYPREDANQGFMVYLSLTIWFGAKRNNLI